MFCVAIPNPPQTICVCKRSQRPKLFFSQRLLQFVSCFHKCHARHSSTHCIRRLRRSPVVASTRDRIARSACRCNIGVGGIQCFYENNNDRGQRTATSSERRLCMRHQHPQGGRCRP